MAGPGTGGPFYAALTDEDDNVFGSEHYRWDTDIFRFALRQSEGEAALLEIEVVNPWIDAPSFKYIAPGQHYWLYLAYWDGSAVVPLFFGRLVGHPENIDDFFVTLQFVGRSSRWKVDQLVLAESLKSGSYFDPVFVDAAHRNDPQAVIDARPVAYHIDPVAHAVTVSHLLTGEDGVLELGEDDVLWGARPRLTQPPLDAVAAEAEAVWSQIDSGGSVFVGAWAINSYSGKSLISDWPKAGASLGGGWFVQASWALDYYDIDGGGTVQSSGGFTDQSPRHNDGDAISGSGSSAVPRTRAPCITFVIKEEGKGGIIGEDYADPSANWSATVGHIPMYRVDCGLYLQYQAERRRSERVSFSLAADLQPVLSDAGRTPEVETISLSSVDLSKPMWEPKPRALLSGAVARGQVALPTNPPIGGSSAYQICISPGTLDSVEPAYGDEADLTTADGTATFAFLGDSLPEIGEWAADTYVSRGTVIAPVPALSIMRSALFPAARVRTSGPSVSQGQIIRDDRTGSFQYCLASGQLSHFSWPNFSPFYGVPTLDGSAIFVSLGMQAPGGAFHICTQAGTTGAAVPPPFSTTAGEPVADGGVVWVSLGAGGPSLSIPAGGYPGRVTARNWFSTPRGLLSLEYVLNKSSRLLIERARCVETTLVCPFHVAPLVSLRKNATAPAPTLPGHQVTGKIISYEMTGDGQSGEFLVNMTLASSIGNGGSESAEDGVGVYAEPGVFAPGVQSTAGGVVTIDDAVGYTPPSPAPNDDGLTFPLTAGQAVARAQWIGSAALQASALRASLRYIIAAANPTPPLNVDGMSIPEFDSNRFIASRGPSTVDAALSGLAIKFALDLRPVTEQSFTTSYRVQTTNLRVPKMIDIAA
ncbi:hypothetical protein [Methylocystis parvus]|uniref:hypothetical protein n=1 Tax=Methylocystis parvus TaxID=134 RepID=UPI003C7798AB